MMLGDWQSIREAGAELVGGKAWNLARLARYGLNVPAGAAIPVTAYRQWLAASGSEADLLNAASQAGNGRDAALGAITARLSGIPTGLDLSGLPKEPLAVRSSAPQEDSARASFAGIHTSCLNVQGDAAVEEAIRRVWLSLWSPQAVAYRERIGLAHEHAAMAVLVMPLIAARASGIAFSRDPISGRDDRMIIHATHGLGESLVGGMTTGDEIVLAEDHLDDSLGVLDIRPGDKSVRVEPADGGGTEAHRLPADTSPVLDAAQSLQLGEQLRLAVFALDYTRPDFDMEWAWDGNRFWVLQARPITAFNRCTYPELASQPDIWSRGNTRDVVPHPLSPIDWGASRRLVNVILQQGFGMAGLRLHPGVQRAGLFHGRLYLNLSVMQWEGYASIGVKPEAMNRLVGGHQPEIRVPESGTREKLQHGINMLRYIVKAPGRRKAGRAQAEEAMAKAAAWSRQPQPQSDRAFAEALRNYSRYSRGAADMHFLQGSGGSALNFLVDMIEAVLPGEGHTLAAALMTAPPVSVTAAQSYELIDIAKQAMADPASKAWLERRRSGAAGDWRELPEDNVLRRSFSLFLDRYGHRGIYETYTRSPRWREEPGYLLDNMPALAETDLEAQSARSREKYEQAWKRVLQALPWWKRGMLGGMVRAAKESSNEREAARSAIIALLEPARSLLLALGDRWVAAGWLDAADDIFFLLQAEIYAVLDGVLPGTALAPRIIDRKRQFEAWQAEEARDVILEKPDGSVASGIDIEAPLPENADCFHGIPVGAGRATGSACLLHSPEQGELLTRGGILVVPSTDPAWTPLFLKAGGLVMETGGYLSHGAIVAREFGIPAVVNMPGILDRLVHGEQLEVDGYRGTVSRQGKQKT